MGGQCIVLATFANFIGSNRKPSRSSRHTSSSAQSQSFCRALRQTARGVPHHLTADQESQRSFNSTAQKGPAGRWITRASLPIPRSEMAWATEWAGRLHVIGGYGEGRVDRGYHHVYEPRNDQWHLAAPLPRGANHVAVVSLEGRIYAFGGFIEQNRNPDNHAYVYEVSQDKWTSIAPLPRPRGAAAAVALNGKLHLIGGASSPQMSVPA